MSADVPGNPTRKEHWRQQAVRRVREISQAKVNAWNILCPAGSWVIFRPVPRGLGVIDKAEAPAFRDGSNQWVLLKDNGLVHLDACEPIGEKRMSGYLPDGCTERDVDEAITDPRETQAAAYCAWCGNVLPDSGECECYENLTSETKMENGRNDDERSPARLGAKHSDLPQVPMALAPARGESGPLPALPVPEVGRLEAARAAERGSMSKAKRTPGPWHTSDGVYGDHSVCGPIQSSYSYSGGGTVAPCVAVVHGRGSEVEAFANATLIASAPELLAVAKSLVAWDERVLAGEVENIPSLLEIIEAARAALRKAGVE